MTDLDLSDVVAVGREAASVDVGALAKRGGVPGGTPGSNDVASVFRATWALVLARLAGVERARVEGVTIDVPREGDVDGWLRSHVATNGAAKSVIDDGGVAWKIEGTTATANVGAQLAQLVGEVVARVATATRLEEIVQAIVTQLEKAP